MNKNKIFGVLLGALVISSGVCWLAYANTGFRVAIPTPRLPVPNAFGKLLKTDEMIKESYIVCDIYSQVHPGDTYLASEDGGGKIPLAHINQAVRENAAVVPQLRSARLYSAARTVAMEQT